MRDRAARQLGSEVQRRALAAEFGWTLLALEAREDRGARALVVRGEVALPRMISGVEQRLAPLLPAGWRLDVAGVSARARIGWRTVGPGVARLWRAPRLVQETGAKRHVPGASTGFAGLSSELVAADGPVELLHALALTATGFGQGARLVVGHASPPLARPQRFAAAVEDAAAMAGFMGVIMTSSHKVNYVNY